MPTTPARRYRPSPKAVAALQLTYELQILPTAAYDAIFGSKANRSEQLTRLLDAGLLVRVPDPVRRPGPPGHYYALTPAAYPYLTPLPPGTRRPPAVDLTPELLLAAGTGHLLAAGTFARACLAGLPAALAPAWRGEPSVRMGLTADHSGVPGTYVEPDGVLLVAGPIPAWFYECDRGTEHKAKWAAKLGRYGRLATQRGWPPAWGSVLPPLLVTAPAGALEDVAGHIADTLAATPVLRNWTVWIAPHDEVSTPAGIAAAAWRQICSERAPAPALYPPAWSLPAILAADRELPAQAAARQREAAEVERRRAFEAQRLEIERSEAAARRQREEEERARAAALAALVEDRRRADAEQEARAAQAQAEIAAAEAKEARRAQIRGWSRLLAGSVGIIVGTQLWITFCLSLDPQAAVIQSDPHLAPGARLLAYLDLWSIRLLLAPFVVGLIALYLWIVEIWESDPAARPWLRAAGVIMAMGVLVGWTEFWWQADPGLGAVWAAPDIPLYLQVAESFQHASLVLLLLPGFAGFWALGSWRQRRYPSSW